jgi:hypothetical protein
MKKLFLVSVLLVLALAAFGLEFSGATSAEGIQNAENEGQLEAKQEVTLIQGPLSVAGSLAWAYPFATEVATFEWELSPTFTAGQFTFGGTLDGTQDLTEGGWSGDLLDGIKGTAAFASGPFFADAEVQLSVAEGEEWFQGAELSGGVNVWLLCLRAGISITDLAYEGANCPAAPDHGGGVGESETILLSAEPGNRLLFFEQGK